MTIYDFVHAQFSLLLYCVRILKREFECFEHIEINTF